MSKYLFSLLVLICLSQNVFADEIAQSWQCRDYSISRVSFGKGTKITIVKNGVAVFEIHNNISPDVDVNPELIVSMAPNNCMAAIRNYSGGEQCCYDAIVFSMGTKFSEVARFNGNVGFKNVNGKALDQVIVPDEYSQWLPVANKIYGQVILRYQDGAYVLGKDLMKKQFSQSEIDDIIFKLDDNYDNFVYVANFIDANVTKKFSNQNIQASVKYLNRLLPKIIDLIYSGNYKQAMAVIDKSWPGTGAEKDQFVQDLLQNILSKQYGQQILSW
jgi:hypothetical protein